MFQGCFKLNDARWLISTNVAAHATQDNISIEFVSKIIKILSYKNIRRDILKKKQKG